MISSNSIQAGAAFVRLMADDAEMAKGLGRAQDKFKAFAGALSSTGTQIQTALLTPFNALRQSLNIFSGFDDQIRMVKAVSGAGGAAFGALTEKAKKLGRETAFTAQQVAQGMTALGRMGFKPKEIDAAIPSVMALSSATGTELAEAAQIAANNLRVFGMSAGQTEEIADLLAVTANGSAQTLADLGESLKMAGPHARNAGEDVKDVCASLGILANMGIRGSLAGTALGKSYKQMADPKVSEFLKLYGVRTKDAAGNLRKMRDILVDVGNVMRNMPSADRIEFAEKIFDARGSLGGGILARNMDGFDEFLEKLEDSSGAAKKTMQEMESGIGGMKRAFLSAAEGVSIALGEVLSGPVIELGKSFTQTLLSLRAWISDNSALVRILAGSVTSLVGFSVALKGAGAALGMLRSLFAPLKTLPAAFSAIAAAAATSAGTMGKVLTVNNATLVTVMRLAAGGKGLTAVFYAKAIAAKTAAGAMGLLAGAMKLVLAHPIAVAFAAAIGTVLILKNHADSLTAALEKAYNLYQKMADKSGAELQAGDENRMENKTAAERLKELEELSKKAKLTAAQVREAQELLARLEFGTGKGSYGKVENGRVTLNGDIETRVKENNRAEAERALREQLRNKTLELNAAKAVEANILNGKRFNLDIWNTDERRAKELAEANKNTLKALREKLDLEKRLRDLRAGKEGAETGNAKRNKAEAEAEKRERWIDPAKLAEAKDAAAGYENDIEEKKKGRYQAEIDALHKKQEEFRKNIGLLMEQEKIELRIAKRTLKRADTPENRKNVAEREKRIAELEARLRASEKNTADAVAGIYAKRAEAEKKYTDFQSDFNNDLKRKNEERELDQLKKSSETDWKAKLEELEKSRKAELAALWKQYDAALNKARAADSEGGSEISGSEGGKLQDLQDEIRKRQEQIDSYRARIESGRSELEKKAEQIDVRGSFSGAALARMMNPNAQLETRKVNYLKKIADATAVTSRSALTYA